MPTIDAEEHEQREGPDHVAAEDAQRDAGCRARCVPVKNVRGSVSLIERLRMLSKLVPLAAVQVLPDPVEDDDRVVQRVAHDREQAGHHEQAHLEPREPDEGDAWRGCRAPSRRRPRRRSATRSGTRGRPAPRGRTAGWRGPPSAAARRRPWGRPPRCGGSCSCRRRARRRAPAARRRAVAWVSLASVPSSATRARITSSRSEPKVWISAPSMPRGLERVRAARRRRPASGSRPGSACRR